MFEELNFNVIVSNIVNENRASHCRLCLNFIEKDYVRFDDVVSLNPSDGIFQPLSEILVKLLGENICDEIIGIEVVCTNCVETALTTARFLDKCRNSTDVLNILINNLCNKLCLNLKGDKDKILYIVINELDSDLKLVNKPQNKRKNISKHLIECSHCNEVFGSLDVIKAHNFSVHNTWTCETCFEAFTSETNLSSHKSKNHKYKCPECSQYSDSKESLNDHQDLIHNLHVCKECGKSCQGLTKLHSHEEKHKIKNCCPKCGKTYTTKEFFERHVDLCLNNLIDPHPIRSSLEKSFTCEKCEKAYSTQGGLRVHNRFVHGNAKPHVCPECGKQFTAPSYLKVHMIKHTGEKNFKCDICNNKFVSKEALLYHTRRHTGEKPYSCKFCNEKFVNASARAEHIKFKHVGPTLMCEICSRKFVTSHFLRQHISRHHDPASKLYYGRNTSPPNLPVEENMRKIIKTEII